MPLGRKFVGPFLKADKSLRVTRFAAAGQRDRLIKISGSSVKPVEKRGLAQWHRVLVACAAASMRYHDEIRVFSRLVAKSVVGNNQ
jgi:hypothetical protein